MLCLLLPMAQAQGELAAEFREVTKELRNIGKALLLYKKDHNSTLPPRLTDLVTKGYLRAYGLVSVADPSRGREGSVPDAYPWDQFPETDEPGSSFLYEFNDAPCTWWLGYVGSSEADANKVDTDGSRAVTWAEANHYQSKHGDTAQKPRPRAYEPRCFPIVRCFWIQYPGAASASVDATVLNLALDCHTVFASPRWWELAVAHYTPGEAPQLRDLTLEVDSGLITLPLPAVKNELSVQAGARLELPLWPKGLDVSDFSYRLVAGTEPGQTNVYGEIVGNLYRWQTERTSPSEAAVRVEMRRGDEVVASKTYEVEVSGTRRGAKR